jgi:hypothetical protein
MPIPAPVLRFPSELELTFYNELLAPVLVFASSSPKDAIGTRQSRLLAQRFNKEIARYGYLLTEKGVMVKVELDILDDIQDPSVLIRVAIDMQIFVRLSDRRD